MDARLATPQTRGFAATLRAEAALRTGRCRKPLVVNDTSARLASWPVRKSATANVQLIVSRRLMDQAHDSVANRWCGLLPAQGGLPRCRLWRGGRCRCSRCRGGRRLWLLLSAPLALLVAAPFVLYLTALFRRQLFQPLVVFPGKLPLGGRQLAPLYEPGLEAFLLLGGHLGVAIGDPRQSFALERWHLVPFLREGGQHLSLGGREFVPGRRLRCLGGGECRATGQDYQPKRYCSEEAFNHAPKRVSVYAWIGRSLASSPASTSSVVSQLWR